MWAPSASPSAPTPRRRKITISDPRGENERIFDEFYRARTLETQQVKGSGLGLTIAKEIVEIHGGRISCEAAEGGGSVFSFTLPTRT